MLKFDLLKDLGVLVIEPRGALTSRDFEVVSHTIDPYIRDNGKLTGMLIEAPSFPGWESFGAFIEHLKFVHEHHRKIERVAIVTDSKILELGPNIAKHFAHPQFKVFRGAEKTKALQWLQGA